MNLETENPMSTQQASNSSIIERKRTAELEELLIDAEADDEQAQQTHPVLQRPWLLLLACWVDMGFSVSRFIDQLPRQGFGPFRVALLDGIEQFDMKVEHRLASR